MTYKKIFIESGIFTDTNDREREYYDDSLNVLYYLIENSIHIYTSCSIIHTILQKNDKNSAISAIENISKFAKIVELSSLDVTKACRLIKEDKNYLSLEYTIEYILAKKAQCKIILSNSNDFYASDIKVISARNFGKDID